MPKGGVQINVGDDLVGKTFRLEIMGHFAEVIDGQAKIRVLNPATGAEVALLAIETGLYKLLAEAEPLPE